MNNVIEICADPSYCRVKRYHKAGTKCAAKELQKMQRKNSMMNHPAGRTRKYPVETSSIPDLYESIEYISAMIQEEHPLDIMDTVENQTEKNLRNALITTMRKYHSIGLKYINEDNTFNNAKFQKEIDNSVRYYLLHK